MEDYLERMRDAEEKFTTMCIARNDAELQDAMRSCKGATWAAMEKQKSHLKAYAHNKMDEALSEVNKLRAQITMAK